LKEIARARLQGIARARLKGIARARLSRAAWTTRLWQLERDQGCGFVQVDVTVEVKVEVKVDPGASTGTCGV